MPTPFRPALAGVAAAVAAAVAMAAFAGSATAQHENLTLLENDSWITYTEGGADFTASGYCTGTWSVCGQYTDQMGWYSNYDLLGDGPIRDIARLVYVPEGTPLSELNDYPELAARTGWPALATNPALDGFGFIGNGGVLFRSFVDFGGGNQFPVIAYAVPNASQHQNVDTNLLHPAFGHDIEAFDNLVLTYALDVSSVSGFGGSGGDPSLVPEINGSGFAYIAFILGSLGLWLYSGAGRREPEAVAV